MSDSPPSPKHRLLPRPLASRDFRLLWVGESVSLIGNQFYLVALPWLALRLTSSGFAIGAVLMTAAIPRAVFMLAGGALSDRFTPRSLMLISNLARAFLTAIIAVLVHYETIETWHLYVLSALFGLFDAFFYPAFTAIVPRLLPKEQLATGHSLLQGSVQFMMLLGPALAGILITAGGLGLVFGFDAGTFIFAALMLWLMRDRDEGPATTSGEGLDGPHQVGVIAAIREGLRYTWNDTVLRAALLIIAATNFSFAGPFTVGLASLAAFRFRGDATAFGTMLSAWGGGALLGAVVSGSLSRVRNRGLLLVATSGTLGVGLALLGFAPSLLTASIIIFVMGFGSGFINVQVFAWLQGRTDQRMQGRVMSLVLFAAVGLAPLSYALAASLVEVNATIMFIVAGAIVLAAAVFTASNRELRTID